MMFSYHFWRFYRLGLLLGFSIGYDVFGYALLIPHYGTIVVNADTRCGNYCVLHTSICIGGSGKRIGNGFYCGTGAKVMGPILLGDNVSVASMSLVNKTFTDNNILLADIPAIKKKERKAWYLIDGEPYLSRHNKIEELKKRMRIE